MPSSWFNLVSIILFESALLAGVDLTDLLMEQPQLNKFHLPQMQLGGICLAKQMTSYMRGKSQQPHGVILLFVSLCKFNSQVPMERPTFGMVMICVTVLSLSIIAALACVAAEFKRTKVRLRERERGRLPFWGAFWCIFCSINDIIHVEMCIWFVELVSWR